MNEDMTQVTDFSHRRGPAEAHRTKKRLQVPLLVT